MEHRASIPPGLPWDNPTISYWQDPPSRLASTRTTKDLPDTADYVIIGSGISGAFIAFNILQREPEAKVVMLEARAACSGATGRNGGHTKAASYRSFPSHATTHGALEAVKIARLEYANIQATHAFAAQHNIACESRPCATVDVFFDDKAFRQDVAATREMGESMESEGVGDPAAVYETLNVEAARTETMCRGEGVVGALKYEAGSIHAYKLVTGVLELCLRKGLNLQTHTPVTELGILDGGGEGMLRTAVTQRGTIAAANIIVATNGYASHLLPQLRGRIVPLRGQMTAQRPSSKLAGMNPHGLPTTYSFIYPGGYEYMIPRPQLPGVPASAVGTILIGGGIGVLPEQGLSEYGETNDCVLNETNSTYLQKTLPRFFGDSWGPDDAVVEKEWTGVMGVTADGLPFVGQVPDEKGLWVSAGFNGHGMVLCLKCAEALVSVMLGHDQTELGWFPESFRINKERLAAGRFTGRI